MHFKLSLMLAVVTATTLCAQGPETHAGGGPGDAALLRAEFGFANKVVTGAPYSAQAVTQFTQTLANGDHIQRTTTASVFRDSQGRMRTERSAAAMGSLSATGARAIVIHDPVAGVSYALDPANKTARSMMIPAARNRPAGDHVARQSERASASAKIEDLGTQVIQGVNAQGKRVTRVIPAGRVGNEKDIDIVTETWYSPDLQVVVMSKTSDPRFGDSVYQLNSINRAEPDPTLFVVPSDYTVTQGPRFGRRGAARVY